LLAEVVVLLAAVVLAVYLQGFQAYLLALSCGLLLVQAVQAQVQLLQLSAVIPFC
jgi:hypothetical protein